MFQTAQNKKTIQHDIFFILELKKKYQIYAIMHCRAMNYAFSIFIWIVYTFTFYLLRALQVLDGSECVGIFFA